MFLYLEIILGFAMLEKFPLNDCEHNVESCISFITEIYVTMLLVLNNNRTSLWSFVQLQFNLLFVFVCEYEYASAMVLVWIGVHPSVSVSFSWVRGHPWVFVGPCFRHGFRQSLSLLFFCWIHQASWPASFPNLLASSIFSQKHRESRHMCSASGFMWVLWTWTLGSDACVTVLLPTKSSPQLHLNFLFLMWKET